MHQYVLAGPGTCCANLLRAAQRSMATPARVLYVAPAALRSALARPYLPTGRHGASAFALIDVQAIYDRWSYGSVAAGDPRFLALYRRNLGYAMEYLK
ncbi:MAG: hypothetical protein U0074_05360 [Kouleothrix sp.]